MLKKALRDTNKKVRKCAFLGLVGMVHGSKSKYKNIISCLLPLLTDSSWHIRFYVAWYLCYFEDYAKYVPLDYVVIAFLDEGNQRVRRNLERLMRAILKAQNK